MELLVSAKLAHPKFHGIPWDFFCYLIKPFVSSILRILNLDIIPWSSSFQILMKIIFNIAGWISMCVLLSIFAWYHMHFRHYSLRIKISFKISFQCSLKHIFDHKSSMEQHLFSFIEVHKILKQIHSKCVFTLKGTRYLQTKFGKIWIEIE